MVEHLLPHDCIKLLKKSLCPLLHFVFIIIKQFEANWKHSFREKNAHLIGLNIVKLVN